MIIDMYAKIKSYKVLGGGMIDLVLEGGVKVKNFQSGMGGFCYGWGFIEDGRAKPDIWLVDMKYISTKSPERARKDAIEDMAKQVEGFKRNVNSTWLSKIKTFLTS